MTEKTDNTDTIGNNICGNQVYWEASSPADDRSSKTQKFSDVDRLG
jgi:hypothetical protein